MGFGSSFQFGWKKAEIGTGRVGLWRHHGLGGQKRGVWGQRWQGAAPHLHAICIAVAYSGLMAFPAPKNGIFRPKNGVPETQNRDFQPPPKWTQKWDFQTQKFTFSAPKRWTEKIWDFQPQNGIFSPKSGIFRPKNGIFGPKIGILSPKSAIFSPKSGIFPPKMEILRSKIGIFSPKMGFSAPKMPFLVLKWDFQPQNWDFQP